MLDQTECLARLWLSLSESLSSSSRRRLVEWGGSYSAVYEELSEIPSGIISDKAMDELKRLKSAGPDKLLLRLEALEIQFCFMGDKDYPDLLANIPDPPDVLFYRGRMKADEGRAVSIVGSRRETRYGRSQAYAVAKDLASQGVTVVSGLARGIDTAAHKGALDAKGRTIAVLGSGLSNIYPQENIQLAQDIIASGGAVVTELPPNTAPLAFRFPARNRIVSGLSHALLLAEAREKSGTLITVGHALDQGREVFAIPGEVDSPASIIPNRMIREGARLCTSAQDILEDMGWASRQEQPQQLQFPVSALTEVQQQIVDSLVDEAKGFEELMESAHLDAASLNQEITLLELEGVITGMPGKMYKLSRA